MVPYTVAKLSSIFIEDEEEKDIGDSSHLISNTEPTPKDIREDCITVTVDAQIIISYLLHLIYIKILIGRILKVVWKVALTKRKSLV